MVAYICKKKLKKNCILIEVKHNNLLQLDRWFIRKLVITLRFFLVKIIRILKGFFFPIKRVIITF
jgi:hypothetical protein